MEGAERADRGEGDMAGGGGAEPAGTDDEDARGQQLLLALLADLVEDEMAGVAMELGFAELHGTPADPSDALEQRGREVALGEIGQDDDDRLARHLGPQADLEPGGERRAARDADRQAFELGDLARRLERRLVADSADLVDQRLFEELR